MCRVGFKFREKEFSLFLVRSDGDIEVDDAIVVAIEMISQAAAGLSAKDVTRQRLWDFFSYFKNYY